MGEQVPSKERLPLLEWVLKRLENCQRLAATKTGADRDGWLEDADYFSRLLRIVDGQALMALRQIAEECEYPACILSPAEIAKMARDGLEGSAPEPCSVPPEAVSIAITELEAVEREIGVPSKALPLLRQTSPAAVRCSCGDFPGADEFCTAHKFRPSQPQAPELPKGLLQETVEWALQSTEQQKHDAFEWLRKAALDGNEHASIAVLEWTALKTRAAPPPGERRESGWLVEHAVHPRLYRYFDETGCVGWTNDPERALRFARRTDAASFSATDSETNAVVEHVFVTPPTKEVSR